VDLLVEFRREEKASTTSCNLAFLLEDRCNGVSSSYSTALSPHLGPHILEEVQDLPLEH